MRPDKNIGALIDHIKSEIAQIYRSEELENLQIRQRIIAEQRKLKEKKEKQKRFVFNEFRRKYSETQEQKHERLAKERAARGHMTKSQAQSEGPLEHHKIYQLFEERKASYQTTSKKPDLTVVIRLSPDQLS